MVPPALTPTSPAVKILVVSPFALPFLSSHTVPDTVIQERVTVWVESNTTPQAHVLSRRALPKSLHCDASVALPPTAGAGVTLVGLPLPLQARPTVGRFKGLLKDHTGLTPTTELS